MTAMNSKNNDSKKPKNDKSDKSAVGEKSALGDGKDSKKRKEHGTTKL